jgi:hypothetical protein
MTDTPGNAACHLLPVDPPSAEVPTVPALGVRAAER